MLYVARTAGLVGLRQGEHRKKALAMLNTEEIAFEPVFKDEHLQGGWEGKSDRGLTFEGNVPPVWGTRGNAVVAREEEIS